MQYPSRQLGITLIEVMVAVLIFSVGLVGVAGLLVMSARSNHAAYLRTQVTFLAQGMADRMQANPIGVWNGDYNGSYPNGNMQDCAAGCTPAQLAVRDKGVWSRQLDAFLPSGVKADIACSSSHASALTREQIALRPPYGGQCMMTITWTERSVMTADSNVVAHSPQTFAWAFQP